MPVKKHHYLRWLTIAALLFIAWFCWRLFGPNPPIIVSKETTYITEPLRPDGLPDYQRYVREKLRDGATPENNAAVLILQAMGPGKLKPNEQIAVAKELGITLPLSGRTLTRLYGKTNRELVAKLLGDQFSTPICDRDDIVYDAIDAAMGAPWSSDEFQPIAAWIEENQQQLDLLVGLSKRSGYYFPSPSLLNQSSDDPWFFGPDGGFSSARDAARVMCVRAMWNLGEGRSEAAWQCILAVHRLARLLSQNETTIDQLVAIAIDGIARDATITLLADDHLPASLAHQIQIDLTDLQSPVRFADAFDGLERISFLASIPYFAECGAASSIAMMNMESEPTFNPLDYVSIDWNVTLREGNQWYDRLAAAFHEPDGGKRRLSIATIEAELRQFENQLQQPATWFASAVSRHSRSRMAAAGVIASTASVINALASAMDRTNTQLELTRLAAALAVYRADHGQYPDKLDALMPDMLPQLPVDLYHAKSLVYKRETDGYLLYSTGENGVDDGGSHEQYGGILAGRDIGWNDDDATQNLREQIPAGADDLAIRVPRPAFRLPTPPASE